MAAAVNDESSVTHHLENLQKCDIIIIMLTESMPQLTCSIFRKLSHPTRLLVMFHLQRRMTLISIMTPVYIVEVLVYVLRHVAYNWTGPVINPIAISS